MAKSSASRLIKQGSGATATHAKGTNPGRDVLEVAFKPARGGLISETRIRRKVGKSASYDLGPSDSETAVHPSIGHAVKHLKDTFGSSFGGDGEGDNG